MALNLRGMWLTIKAALHALRESKGVIVNVSSLASIAPAGILAYELSKAGVNKLTTTIAAQEARRGVRCNAILPGLIDTPMAIQGWAAMNAQEQEAVRARRNARVPLGAMGTAWDVAWAAVYLASDEARFVTGVLLPVDGGMSVRVG
jgi:NAD(P)-dependent dehydrogenase (short-subunit alcohol dehydrogenase family)